VLSVNRTPRWDLRPAASSTAGSTCADPNLITCSSETDCIFGSTYLDSNSNQFSITVSTTNARLAWARTTRFPSSLDGGVASAGCDQRYCFILAENAATADRAPARTNDNGKTWTLVPYPHRGR
jgi:hypothetical protein